MSNDYHPMLEGPAEPFGLAMEDANALPSILSSGDDIVDAVRMKLLTPDDAGDVICQRVAEKLASRSAVGQLKYGVKLTRTDLSRRDWLQHAQEEAMDLANYLEVLIHKSRFMTIYHDWQEQALSMACILEVDIQAAERAEKRLKP